MTVHHTEIEPIEHFVPAAGEPLPLPLSRIFGFGGRPGSSPQLREELAQIREAEQKADQVSATIKLY